MPRRSSIDRLPAQTRELIGKLRREHGCTIDAIHAKLNELDTGVSRSALGRHVKRMDAIGKEIQHSRMMAEALIAQYGEADEHRTARLNLALMHGVINRLLFTEAGERVELTAKEAALVSGALQKLVQASKQDVERERALRQTFTAKVEAEAKKQGLSADVTAALRAALGHSHG